MKDEELVVKNERSFYSRAMPRVSDEYRAQRRQQILAAARRCFVREGFHQTSMTDIFAEAGLSAGAVYGYFKGKDEIIAAIVDDVIGHVQSILEPIIGREPPPTLADVVLEGLTKVESFAFAPDGFGRLAPQVWAEATRSPVLAETLRARYSNVFGQMTELIAAEQKLGRVDPAARPEDVVAVLFGAITGYILQRAVFGNNLTPVGYAAGVAAMTAPLG